MYALQIPQCLRTPEGFNCFSAVGASGQKYFDDLFPPLHDGNTHHIILNIKRNHEVGLKKTSCTHKSTVAQQQLPKQATIFE